MRSFGVHWRGSLTFKLAVLEISIVIDSDRGHCYEHLKKNDENWPVTYIWMFVYSTNFELPEMSKKWTLDFSGPNLHASGLFHPNFVCKSSFRVISMIKMVISDQSKPIYHFWKKIKILKIQNLYIAHLLFIKTEIRQVYNPHWNQILHLLCSIMFFVRWRVKKLSTGGPGEMWDPS